MNRQKCTSYAKAILLAGYCDFLRNNATCYVERSTMDWCDDNEVSRLKWPSQGSDLNSIENLWDELDHRIMGCGNHPKLEK
ncbi:hypothetical protein TNCV_4014921 [Trichonephila clavipes]|uniref:Tc1-like transposase DDE domain-containing protein n=1 Tax=Trichonephila clavipes TaxID=2585209 RepID=A0A8X6V359_TRICX|nr:hypothetical protein TNCV_4014921 [Trichonephila clavipes]